MQVADILGLAAVEKSDLYFTLLLKDLGCSSNAARICQLYLTDDLAFKKDFKLVDGTTRQGFEFVMRNTGTESGLLGRIKTLTHVLKNAGDIAQEVIQTRCDRGAEIARLMRFSETVAQGIAGLDEHWDGGGRPVGAVGNTIPLNARIALMAQVTDVFTMELGAHAAAIELKTRSGKWFDPELVPVFLRVIQRGGFEKSLRDPALESIVFANEPAHHTRIVDDDYLDEISYAFARVIDAKSPFTHGHSERVATYTDMICRQLGYDHAHRRWMARAALLHDIGKLGISNAVLDKPGKLTDDEFRIMKSHPVMGQEILSRVEVFSELNMVAMAHHERLDGKGYPYGKSAPSLTRNMRVLAVADIFDALTADRPYRAALSLEKTYEIMDDMAGSAIDPDCYSALKTSIAARDHSERSTGSKPPNLQK